MATGIKISKQLVGINAASTVLTRIISICVLLGVQYYLLRRVSPEEFSLYPLMTVLLLFLPLLLNIFLNPATRYVTLAYADDDRKRITEIVSTLAPIAIMAGLGLLVSGLIACFYIDKIVVVSPAYLFDARLMLVLIVATEALTLMLAPFSTAFHALQRITINNTILLSGEVTKAVVLSVLLLGVSPRILWFAVAHFIATVAVEITRAVMSRRMIPELIFRRSAIRWSMTRELMGFGFAVLLTSFSDFLRGAAPIWILNRFAGPIDVTSYHLGQSAYRHSMQLWMPVRQNTGAVLVAMTLKKQHARLRQTYYRGGRIALWLVLFISAPLLLFHEEVVRLYAGDTYQLAGSVMLLLLLRLPLQMMNGMLPQLATAKAQIWPLAMASFGTECVSIAAMLMVVGGYESGALAAAVVALLISVVSELFVVWHIGLSMVDGTRRDSLRKSLFPGVLPAVVAGLFWYMLLQYFQPDTWGQLLLAILPGWLIYFGTGLGCFLPEDRHDMNSAMTKISNSVKKLRTG